jgi:hypothetical protein
VQAIANSHPAYVALGATTHPAIRRPLRGDQLIGDYTIVTTTK